MEYVAQHVQDIIGTSDSPSTLTDDYTDNQSLSYPIGGMHSIVVYVQYTPNALETNAILYMRVELGPEEDDVYLMTKRVDVSGDDSLFQRCQYDEYFIGATGGTTYKERFALGDIADKYFRVSFYESPVSKFGTLYAKIVYSGK